MLFSQPHVYNERMLSLCTDYLRNFMLNSNFITLAFIAFELYNKIIISGQYVNGGKIFLKINFT